MEKAKVLCKGWCDDLIKNRLFTLVPPKFICDSALSKQEIRVLLYDLFIGNIQKSAQKFEIFVCIANHRINLCSRLRLLLLSALPSNTLGSRSIEIRLPKLVHNFYSQFQVTALEVQALDFALKSHHKQSFDYWL